MHKQLITLAALIAAFGLAACKSEQAAAPAPMAMPEATQPAAAAPAPAEAPAATAPTTPGK